jgi:SAM-dependent methyltransferase
LLSVFSSFWTVLVLFSDLPPVDIAPNTVRIWLQDSFACRIFTSRILLSSRVHARLKSGALENNMIDDVSDIAAYYNTDPEMEHGRLELHQLEYELTWRYLNQHLPFQGSILEIGAATGRYTLELAKHGYTITAVDLSAALLEQNRKSIANEGLERQVRFVIADARDLSEVNEKGFDAILFFLWDRFTIWW